VPFPLAWLALQEATLMQSQGRIARARELLEEAHRRLPQDVAVASHLAAISDRETALDLLRQIVAVSDDPEHLAALADLGGDAALRRTAAARYQELLAHHPAAFADHAARFYVSSQPRRALALAETNLEARRTGESLALVVQAANAAGETARACRVAGEGLAQFPQAAPLRFQAATAFSRCGKAARAEGLL
jgi:hypothetical protein